MTEDTTPEPAADPGLLARRLEYLFQTKRADSGKPYTHVQVADAINAAAGDKIISQAYINQLRRGVKTNPTRRHLAALADFFGVSVLYFFDGDPATDHEGPRDEAELALQDEAVKNVAMRAAGLSPETLRMIQDMIDRARTLEGLQEYPGPEASSDSA
ncbi:helix-turn-helix domain-containing protein [Actinomadura atramentaria]|uniref:helix-turn-helix domain-containing protein n=1 Tax=Actinomadura atramentaria TaxID=1990 RepID=UPI0003813347|nr:helix-turn-helix transcriptional regulator [Actinomadura atramentaria]